MKFAMVGMDQLQGGNNDGLTDQTLMRRLKSGESDAATQLYQRYAKRLHRLATYQTSDQLSYRINSEEIVQSVFRTFFRRASQGQYDISDCDDLWKLLLVITLNKIRRAAEFHFAEKRDVSKTQSIENGIHGAKTSLAENQDVTFSILKLTIAELLEGLPERHQQMVRLRIEGFNLPEIAAQTSRAQRTVERVLKAFRSRLLKLVRS